MFSDHRVHATLPAADIQRAKRWYEEKLGVTPVTENPGGAFYVVGGGTRFVLYPTPNTDRAGHTQMGLTTSDIEADVSELKGRGVVFEEYDFPGLQTVDGIATTGLNRSAWFKDSEGNTIGIVQLQPGVDPAEE